MTHLIDDTLKIANTYLQDFGFTQEQVEPLLVQAKKDLTRELEKSREIFNAEVVDHEAVNSVLHALKGLLFSLGNNTLAEKIEALRTEDAKSQDVSEIKALLFGDDT